MNHKKLKLCQVQYVDEKAMIRNLCNRIPLTSPVTIKKIRRKKNPMTTTEILMFLLDSLPDSVSVSIRLIRKISNRENK